jgi:hypothetical protein
MSSDNDRGEREQPLFRQPARSEVLEQCGGRFLDHGAAAAFVFAEAACGEQGIDQAEFIRFDMQHSQAAAAPGSAFPLTQRAG